MANFFSICALCKISRFSIRHCILSIVHIAPRSYSKINHSIYNLFKHKARVKFQENYVTNNKQQVMVLAKERFN